MEKVAYRAYGAPPEPAGSSGVGGRIRVFASVVVISFVVTLAIMVGQRLSDQAMAVLAGAVCGVGASIPTSLLIISVVRRRQEQLPARTQHGAYPPVVVVQQPVQPGAPSVQQPGYLSPYLPPAQREFAVVGGEMEEVSYGHYQ